MSGQRCPDCAILKPRLCARHSGLVSAPSDTLDALVQQASAPNLVTLFRRAKQAGALSVSEYGEKR